METGNIGIFKYLPYRIESANSMKNIFRVIYIAGFCLQSAFCQPFKSEASLAFLQGSWSYKGGQYIYFDSDHNNLKRTKVTDLHDLKIEVTSSDIKIIYPNQVFYSPYTLTVEKGRKFISFDMGSGMVKYQIVYINSKFLTLKCRHKINLFVDGDPNKKAAYSVFIIYLAKSG